MRKYIYLLIILLLIFAPAVLCQDQQPDSAQSIIRTAISETKSTDDRIFVIFHASWCVWCKWLDAALESPEIKPIMKKYYTIARLDVKEFGEKIKKLENPGGRILLEEMDGTKSGLPFIAVLNRKGKMIANSNVMPKNQNIGYPGSADEIAAFAKLLKTTAPRMTAKQIAVITSYLKKNSPQ